MKKLCLSLALLFLLGSSPVLAIEENQLFTEAYHYTATLYYCDSARNKVVFKNVKPVGFATTEKRRTVQDATYNEIPFSGSARLTDGTYLPPEKLNYYVDGKVDVVIVRNKAEGIRVVAMQLQ